MKNKGKIILVVVSMLFMVVLFKDMYGKLGVLNAVREIEKAYVEDSMYDIYVTSGTDKLSLVQIESIKEGEIEYSTIDNINAKYSEAALLFIEEGKDGKIYVPYSKGSEKNTDNTKRLLIYENGVLEDEIYFEDIRSPQNIISDKENGKLYVEQSTTIQGEGSPGLKVKIIDEKSHEVIGELFIKGYIRHYYIGEEEIILNLEGANKLGFTDSQDRSLYGINRKTLEGRVITKESLTDSITGVCQNKEGDNILFSNMSVIDEKPHRKITLIDKEGNLKEKISSDYDMSDNFYEDEDYEYVLNGKYPSENNGFFRFNKNTLEFEDFVDDVKNISHIECKDGYLFVLTSNAQMVVYDESSLERVGTIDLANERNYRFKVVKKK